MYTSRPRLMKPTLGEIMSRWGEAHQHPQYRGCVAHWMTMEGGGVTLYDISGYGNHGALANIALATAWGTTGQRGHALTFDGASRVDIGNPLALQITGPITVVCVMRLASLVIAARPTILSHGYDSSKAGYTLGFNQVGEGPSEGLGRLCFVTYTGLVTLGSYTTKDFTGETGWVSVGGSWDGTLWHTWVNGLVDRNSQGTQTTGPQSVTSSLALGTFMSSGAPDRFLVGALDDVRIYDRALSEPEMWKIYSDPLAPWQAPRRVWAVEASAITNRPERTMPRGILRGRAA